MGKKTDKSISKYKEELNKWYFEYVENYSRNVNLNLTFVIIFWNLHLDTFYSLKSLNENYNYYMSEKLP